MQFFAFVIAFTCLWPKGQSSFSNIVQVVVVTQEDRLKNNSLSGYVTLENVTDRHNYNITVLKDGWKSYQEILKRFCSIVKNRGVTAIIFKDRSSNFKIFDVFASFMGVPVIKLFHSNYEPQVFKQVREQILCVKKILCEIIEKCRNVILYIIQLELPKRKILSPGINSSIPV